jgi:hypothetical protein
MKDQNFQNRQLAINALKEKPSWDRTIPTSISIDGSSETIEAVGWQEVPHDSEPEPVIIDGGLDLMQARFGVPSGPEKVSHMDAGDELDSSDYYNQDTGKLNLEKIYRNFPLTFRDKTKRLELENLNNLGLLKHDDQKDVLALMAFLSDFVKLDPPRREEISASLSEIRSVKNYENSLFDSRRDATLELRGTPSFSKLSSPEKANYIAHNLTDHTKALDLYKSHRAYFQDNLPTLLALNEKIATFQLHHNFYYKSSEYSDLSIASNSDYKDITKTLVKNLHQLD